MRGQLDRIRAAGADLVFVGNGSVRLAARFQAAAAPGLPVYTDPDLGTYRALGMRRGVLATLGPQTWLAAARAFAGGQRQTGVEGDPWQQGGLFVLAKGGEIVYAQANRDAGERPDLDAALAALRNRAPGGSRYPTVT